MDTISVIMPVKNAGSYLEPCLESIKAQIKTNFNIELVAINDHSSDDSGQILKAWASKEPWVIHKNSDGNGTLDALHKGQELSSGDYISRMDADDLMSTNKMSIFYRTLQSAEPNSVVTGKVSYFRDDQPLGDGFKRYEQWLNKLVDTHSFYDEIYRECPVASANWMMSRDAFNKMGGFGSTYPEDYDMVFRWRLHGLKIIGLDHATHLWRDHGERASRNLELYRDNRFLNLKVRWFLEQDAGGESPVTIIGGGKKGKTIAKLLEAEGVEFSWFTNNPNKVGHAISGVQLENYDPNILNPKSSMIVALASPSDQLEVSSNLEDLGLQHGKHFFLFA